MLNTDTFAAACAQCSRVLFEEFLEHVKRMRDKLLQETRGSKQLWRISDKIIDKSGKCSSVPALKCETGWVHGPAENAYVFAKVFASKFVVPPPVINEFTVELPCRLVRSFVLVRSRHAIRCLENLNADSGTGPDELFVKVLKIAVAQLRFPLTKRVRRIVHLGRWPSA
jgi:hypothetical protein